MSTIKIKFKDSLIFTKNYDYFTIPISFISNGVNYSAFIINVYLTKNSVNIFYDSYNAYNETSWETGDNIIEIDPTQTNFQAFITAMKNNIEGVLVESGEYKWIDEPNTSSQHYTTCSFTSGDTEIIIIGVYATKGGYIDYAFAIGGDTTIYGGGTWQNDNYKTLVSSTDQYIDYDFYNYAILGNQLVKQGGGGGGTNKLKFGTETPTKLYMGETEITKAYMGDVLVYEKE